MCAARFAVLHECDAAQVVSRATLPFTVAAQPSHAPQVRLGMHQRSMIAGSSEVCCSSQCGNCVGSFQTCQCTCADAYGKASIIASQQAGVHAALDYALKQPNVGSVVTGVQQAEVNKNIRDLVDALWLSELQARTLRRVRNTSPPASSSSSTLSACV